MQPGLVHIVEQLNEAFRRGDADAGGKAEEAANVACLGAFYQAVARDDYAGALAQIADDASYVVYATGAVPFRMSGRGRIELEDGVRRNFGVLTFEQVDMESLAAQGNLVILILRQRGHWRHNGDPFDDRAVLEYTFRDGRIVRYRGWAMPFAP